MSPKSKYAKTLHSFYLDMDGKRWIEPSKSDDKEIIRDLINWSLLEENEEGFVRLTPIGTDVLSLLRAL